MKKKRLYMLIAVVGLLLMWGYCGSDALKDGGTAHLLDRPWVNKMPKNPREPHHALVFLSRDKIGASVNGSAYQHLVTVFRHKVKGNKVTLEILQAGKRFTTLAKTYKCKGPDGLDLCLDFGPRVKPLTFYSSSRWTLPGEADTPSFGFDRDLTVPEAKSEITDTDEDDGLRFLTP